MGAPDAIFVLLQGAGDVDSPRHWPQLGTSAHGSDAEIHTRCPENARSCHSGRGQRGCGR